MASEEGRIMFVGMNCLDITTTVAEFPEEDTDRNCLDMRWVRGGNASNSSTVCAMLGGNVQYMGNLADTFELQFFKESFEELGIHYEDCPLVTSQCPRTLVLINASTGSRTIMFHAGGYPELKAVDFRNKVKLTPGKYRWIHFECRPTVGEIEQMIKHVSDFNRTVSEAERITISLELEKNRQSESTYLIKEVDLTFISKDFAMAKGFNDMKEAVEGFQKYCKPGGIIICAWGEKGAAAKAWDQPAVISHAFPPDKLVNTTAAGDTFNAATVMALTKHLTLQEAITYACRVAGAKCGMKGFEDVRRFYLQSRST